MKIVMFFYCLFLLTGTNAYAQLGVKTDNSQPDPSAMLDVKSANKGFLPPRVVLTSINSALPVSAPVAGLFVYNTATAGSVPNNVTPGYYSWNGTKWIPVASPLGSNVGDMLYWNGTQWVGVPIGSNGQVMTINNGIPAWSNQCGMHFTINHVAGTVAPVSKTVIYGTVSNLPGEPLKCWITNNLGADHQAMSVDDATEASAGWYWQFNRKHGYKHDGTTRTPNTAWITSISENSDWIDANDPCNIELGTTWRIPTYTEWNNVDNSGGWTNWNGPWGSGLKLHAAGDLGNSDGSLGSRGSAGNYWSNTQYDATNGWNLSFTSSYSDMNYSSKVYGFSARCIRGY